MSTAINRRQLSPADAGSRLTRDEFATTACQAPFIYERVQGRLVVMSPAGPEHRLVSRPFRRQLSAYWDSHRDLVDDVDVEGWIAIGDDEDRVADICVYLRGQSSREQVPHRVPDLVFEFVSGSVTVHGSGTDAFSRRKTNTFDGRDATSKYRLPVKMGLSPSLAREQLRGSRSDQERDSIHKRREYHRIGVREYVIVDRFKLQVLVLSWQLADYDEAIISIDELYTTPLLPGLTIAVREAFST